MKYIMCITMYDRKKNPGSIHQFPLTFTEQNDLFTLQEHKF